MTSNYSVAIKQNLFRDDKKEKPIIKNSFFNFTKCIYIVRKSKILYIYSLRKYYLKLQKCLFNKLECLFKKKYNSGLQTVKTLHENRYIINIYLFKGPDVRLHQRGETKAKLGSSE